MPADSRADGASPTAPPVLTVAHVIHSLGAGGAEAVLVDLARAAPAAGLRMVVIGLSDAHSGDEVDRRVVPQLQRHGVVVHEMHGARYDPRQTFAVARILRAEAVDIVHTHLKHADLVGGAAARLAGVPSVSTLHVIDTPTSKGHRIRLAAAMRARSLSSAVIALSSEQLRWYRGYAGRDNRITLLPNGVVEPEVSRDAAAIRAEVGVPDGSALAVCVSLMRPEKGHADLLDAVRRMPATVPVVVALAGDGPLLDGIRSRVESDPSLADRVRVLGFRRDVADLLAAADFVVHPSLADALPTALISALAAARPVVATNVGGIPDIVTTDAGVLVDPADPVALGAAMAEMTETVRAGGIAVEAMQRAARKRYEEYFSADVWVTNLRALYERARNGRDSSASRRVVLVEFPPSGGLFQFSLQLGEALARAGDRVELITGPRPELDSREPGCRVHSLLPTWHPAAGAQAPDWWRRARRVVRAARHTAAWGVLIGYLVLRRPDVVMWSEWRFPSDGWAVHLVRRLLPNAVLALIAHEPRVLVEQPGHDDLYKSSPTTHRALAAAYADLDAVFVLGESARRAVLDTWPVTADVQVIPHGDEGIFAADIPGAESTRPLALCFGTITAYKGIDTLLRAWPAVLERVPDARLTIAGSFSADVDASAMRAQIAGIAGVELDARYIPLAEVPGYFARSRCVVLPYKRSSQSGVVHLAYTLQRPVVATRVGDIPDVVTEGESGLLVSPGDPDALAGALVQLLTDAEWAGRMGRAGARALARGATWDQVADRIRQGLPARPATTARAVGRLRGRSDA